MWNIFDCDRHINDNRLYEAIFIHTIELREKKMKEKTKYIIYVVIFLVIIVLLNFRIFFSNT